MAIYTFVVIWLNEKGYAKNAEFFNQKNFNSAHRDLKEEGMFGYFLTYATFIAKPKLGTREEISIEEACENFPHLLPPEKQ